MNAKTKMHYVQANTLHALQHATRARYGELRKISGLESDLFKYHIRRLVDVGYIFKASDGLYELTAEGKAFAGRLDRDSRYQIEQPKSSMLMIASCIQSGTTYILAHQRKREPFYDFWGIASAPVLRGVTLPESARREFLKQTGIDTVFTVGGMYRVIDTNKKGDVLEDKIFALMSADTPSLVEPIEWPGGVSEWMPIDELLSKAKLFPTTASMLELKAAGGGFREDICVYEDNDY